MGASRIQGITVEIGGDTTKLTAALKGVNGEIRTTQSQLRDVERLLKLDPGNTELLAQKHRLLAEAVRETKEKLETLKAAAEQANEALAKGEIEYYPPWEPPVSRFRAIRKWYFPPSEPPQHIVAAHIFDFTINLLIVILGELLMQYHQIIYGEVFLCLRRQKSEVFWNFWEKI